LFSFILENTREIRNPHILTIWLFNIAMENHNAINSYVSHNQMVEYQDQSKRTISMKSAFFFIQSLCKSMPNHPFMAIGFNTSRSCPLKNPQLDGFVWKIPMNTWISHGLENLYTKIYLSCPLIISHGHGK
jgi:hypothetical protein